MTPEEGKELVGKMKEKMGDDDFVWILMQIPHNLDGINKLLSKHNLNKKC